MTPEVHAADPPGGASLAKARAAWNKGAYAKAEAPYRDALEKGGLAPDEVLEGYVRLGAIRTIRGKKDQALAAFRAASVLDATFVVPQPAGAKGKALAERAKRETASIGSLSLSVAAPKEADAKKPFKVNATIDKAHVGVVVKKIVLLTKDDSGKDVVLESAAVESYDFEVPDTIAVPKSSVIVRIDALDGNANRLASLEERVTILDVVAPPAVVTAPPTTTPAGKSAPAAATSDIPSNTYESDRDRKKGGFWSSPWPYVIGTAALAGAGAAVYFGTRPSDNVDVGQVGLRQF